MLNPSPPICRFCGKEVRGVECDCYERIENEKLWDKSLRLKEKRKKVMTKT